MQLLVHEKEIIVVAPKILYGVFDEPFEKWALQDNDGNLLMYVVDSGYTLVENVELPEDYEHGKYFYENDEFVLNEDWEMYKPLPSNEERIAQLEETVAIHEENDAELLYQICLLQLGITEDDLGEEV